MKATEQVCSLELATQLQKLGIRQDSALYTWSQYPDEVRLYTTQPANNMDADDREDLRIEPIAAAFTATELAAALPANIEHGEGDDRDDYSLKIWKGLNEPWGAAYRTNKLPVGISSAGELDTPTRSLFDTQRAGKTMAEPLAAWLILLLESGTITAREVNQRL